MKAVMLIAALAIHGAPAGAVASDEKPLTLRSKTAIVAAVPHRSAPYVNPVGEPERDPLFTPRDPREAQSRSSCEGRDLCYDQGSGRIVYKPARQFMPGIPGMQPENISLKRDRIVFKYTF